MYTNEWDELIISEMFCKSDKPNAQPKSKVDTRTAHVQRRGRGPPLGRGPCAPDPAPGPSFKPRVGFYSWLGISFGLFSSSRTSYLASSTSIGPTEGGKLCCWFLGFSLLLVCRLWCVCVLAAQGYSPTLGVVKENPVNHINVLHLAPHHLMMHGGSLHFQNTLCGGSFRKWNTNKRKFAD